MSNEYLFKSVTAETKLLVWSKGRIISGRDPDIWRKDSNGHSLRFADHGNTGSPFGWEIDHIHPVEHGGTDAIDNLQPLYWETNRIKSDTILKKRIRVVVHIKRLKRR